MSDRQDRIDAEIEACTGCGSREFPKRSNCADCIAAVDGQIANEALIDPRDATITRLRAELAASAEDHSRSAEQFALYVEMTNAGVPPNATGIEAHMHRCAAAAKRAREAAR